ncbi:hypothetical protein [Micrococcus sp.]|uniref:hypothetical protein n=1 Tax=Micrococcus sp. TaxID=1271 RepID=UPI0026DB7F18|nr:hypothetical protein [Micrococcus sp.]MDO4240338.1 hypothetical protein [Micrococcus sp.]
MSRTTPRLAAAVLGVSLTLGLGALPAHAEEATRAVPYASTLSVASDESQTPEEVFSEVVLRAVDRHGEEVELGGPFWSLLGFGGGEEEWGDGDVEDLWPELTPEEEDRLEEIFALWDEDPNAPLTAEQEALLAKAGLENPWGDLTDEEIAALEEIWALLDEDPEAELTAEQEALLEKAGGGDLWPELTDEEEAQLEEIWALLDEDPEAELTAEQEALLERIGWSTEPLDPSEYLTEDQLAALQAYGDTTCMYAGDAFVATLADLFSPDAAVWAEPIDESADWVLVVGRTPCADLTPAELSVQEDLRIELLVDGETESVTRVLVTDPALLAEWGLDEAAADEEHVGEPAPASPVSSDEEPPARGDTAEAPMPTEPAHAVDTEQAEEAEEQHRRPEVVQTGDGAQWWALAGVAVGASVLLRMRRAFAVRCGRGPGRGGAPLV